MSRIKFFLTISLFPLRKFLRLLGIKYDIMETINEHYEKDFNNLSRKDCAVMLPHCLIDKKCPAKFSKLDGIMCINCGLCGCGKIKKISEDEGYQFYITPSVGFTKRLINRKGIKGAIGVTCEYEVWKGMRSEKIKMKGIDVEKTKLIPQGLLLTEYNCVNNSVDWDILEKLIKRC